MVTSSICRRTRRLPTPPAPRMATATSTVAVTDAALERTDLTLAVVPSLARREFAREPVFHDPFGSLPHHPFRCRMPRPPANLQRARAWPDRHRPEQSDRERLDTDKRRSLNLRSSGAPITFDRPRGNPVRCAVSTASASPELPPQLSAVSPFSQDATGLCAARSGKAEKGDDPRARRPA